MVEPNPPHDDRHLLAGVKHQVAQLVARLDAWHPFSPDLASHARRLGVALVAAVDALAVDPGPVGTVPPGQWFSPTEEAIWDALAGGPLKGAGIARAIGEPLNGRISGILANMADRGCLIRGPRGYARVPRKLASACSCHSGRHFSDLEQQVWDALAAGPMHGPQLAAAIREEYGGRLRMILSNLVERRCLVNGARGYARAPRSHAEGGPAAGAST